MLTQFWAITTIKDQYLSSHIWYTIPGPSGDLNVLYNSDIIWKDNYWWTSSWVTTSQIWLKISWISSSQNQIDISTDQGDDLNIIWNIDKTILKRDMRKNVYNLVNQTNINNWTYKIDDLNWDGIETEIWYNTWALLLNKTVIYFWDLNGADILLEASHDFTGKKTIVVIWWNLYIKSNIVNETTSDVLWIIVLKDDYGKWWNLYIDPNVTKIDAAIYTDKSIISYDWTNELDWNTNQFTLRNQLYIYWSVFSENTMGWSINEPPVCPYYVWWICERKDAQKYDLNFLRRYYYVSWSSAINWWINYMNKYNLTDYLYYQYPVVIKYNPKVQTSPPPLFWD